MLSCHTLSDSILSDVTYRLRRANARYARVAFELRCRISFARTHHAKRRALWAGLSIDVEKAKDCPMTAISVRPLPLLDTTPSPSPIMLSFCGSAIEPYNQLGLEIPHTIVPSHGIDAHSHERLIIRIPPLASLYDDIPRHEQHDMIAPGAPLIRTKDLPDDFDTEDICSSRSSSPASPLSPLTPIDIAHSGLRIKIPARKRKLKDADDEDSCPDGSDTQFPKMHMRRRWAHLQATNGRVLRSQIASY